MDSIAPLDPRRVVLGFLVAPAITPITAIVITFLVTKEHQGECVYGRIVGLTIIFGVLASYVSAVVFGAPWILRMHRTGRLNFWTTMVGALVQWAGLFTVVLVVVLCLTGQLRAAYAAGVFAVLYLPGMLLGGAAFYGMAVRSRLTS